MKICQITKNDRRIISYKSNLHRIVLNLTHFLSEKVNVKVLTKIGIFYLHQKCITKMN